MSELTLEQRAEQIVDDWGDEKDTTHLVNAISLIQHITTALRAVEQETWEEMKQAKGVIALIACANCTHQERGDSACAACIGDAVKGWPDRRCAAGGKNV